MLKILLFLIILISSLFLVSSIASKALAQSCSQKGGTCVRQLPGGNDCAQVSGTSPASYSCPDSNLPTCCISQSNTCALNGGTCVNPLPSGNDCAQVSGSVQSSTFSCGSGSSQTCCVPTTAPSCTGAPNNGTCVPSSNPNLCSGKYVQNTDCSSGNVCCVATPVCDQGICRTYSSIDINNGCGKVESPGEWCNTAKTQICCYPGSNGGGGGVPLPNPDCGFPNCNQTQGSFTLQCNGTSCDTALGPISTNVKGLVTSLFKVILSLIGAIAIILIIISGYRLMASQGNPEKIQGAREQLTAAIVGLMFVIFSFVILQIIGVNLLALPGFAP